MKIFYCVMKLEEQCMALKIPFTIKDNNFLGSELSENCYTNGYNSS